MSDKLSMLNDAHNRTLNLQELAIKKIKQMCQGETLGGRKLTSREKLNIYLDPAKRIIMEQKIGDPMKIMEYQMEMEQLKKRSENAIKSYYRLEEV